MAIRRPATVKDPRKVKLAMRQKLLSFPVRKPRFVSSAVALPLIAVVFATPMWARLSSLSFILTPVSWYWPRPQHDRRNSSMVKKRGAWSDPICFMIFLDNYSESSHYDFHNGQSTAISSPAVKNGTRSTCATLASPARTPGYGCGWFAADR